MNRVFPRNILRVVGWAKACSKFSIEIGEGLEDTLLFVRTWDRYTSRVSVAVLSKYSGEASRKTAAPEQVWSAFGPSVSPVALFLGRGGGHICCGGFH